MHCWTSFSENKNCNLIVSHIKLPSPFEHKNAENYFGNFSVDATWFTLIENYAANVFNNNLWFLCYIKILLAW